MTISEYFGEWSDIIDLNEADRIMRRLSVMKDVCPKIGDIFKAFRLCQPKDVRTVLMGQDPYSDYSNGKPVATGLAFANETGTPERLYSPSLEVLRESFIDFTRPHGTVIFEPGLEELEKQGVLLLNAALSCQKGKPGSHSLMWLPFMTSLLKNLSLRMPGVVYVLMGSSAWSFEPYIDRASSHVIRIRHPAYYARKKERMPSDVWNEVNDILIGQNGYGIKWFEEY